MLYDAMAEYLAVIHEDGTSSSASVVFNGTKGRTVLYGDKGAAAKYAPTKPMTQKPKPISDPSSMVPKSKASTKRPRKPRGGKPNPFLEGPRIPPGPSDKTLGHALHQNIFALPQFQGEHHFLDFKIQAINYSLVAGLASKIPQIGAAGPSRVHVNAAESSAPDLVDLCQEGADVSQGSTAVRVRLVNASQIPPNQKVMKVRRLENGQMVVMKDQESSLAVSEGDKDCTNQSRAFLIFFCKYTLDVSVHFQKRGKCISPQLQPTYLARFAVN